MFDRWDESLDGPEPSPDDIPAEFLPVEPWLDNPDWLEELVAGDPERPRSVEEILAEAEHGPVSSALAAELGAIDLNTLTDDQKVAVAVAADRCVNHYEGVKLGAVGAFAGPEPRDDLGEAAFAWCEIAGALHLGEGQARRMVHTGRRLRTHLRGTLAAMRSGDLSGLKAQTLVDATAVLDAEQCAQVEARVLPHAATRNPSNHTAAVGRAVRRVDPDGWKDRREQKLRDVVMIRYLHGDGVADILLRNLDSLQANTLWTAADTWARAQKAAGDKRGMDALRVAAVVTFGSDYLTGTPTTAGAEEWTVPDADDTGDEGAADDTADARAHDAEGADTRDDAPALRRGTPPTRHGAPAVVNVIVHLPDLIDPANGGAARLAGTGEPLPAEAVADLLREGARIRFALVDQNGKLAGISTKLHDPTALTRAFIALRDVTLRVPGGSTTEVAGQDLDHMDADGPTDPTNLHPPSRGWHRAKTFKHWTLTANPDGTITWTSRRTGRSYTTHPYNYRDDP